MTASERARRLGHGRLVPGGLHALVAAAAAVSAAGCGASDAAITRGGTITGPTLTVYSSLPDPERGPAADIVAGEKLALAERGGRIGRFAVNFSSVDEAGGRGRASDAARRPIADTQAIAVIGGLRTAETRFTAPLLNAEGLLHVALGAGYGGFTGAVALGDPGRYEPAGRQTFARFTGDDRAQAEALAAAAADPGARRIAEPPGRAPARRTLAVEAEASPQGEALGAAVRAAAGRIGLRLVLDPARADAVIYAGEEPGAAVAVLDALAREAPRARLLLGEALLLAGVPGRLSAPARRRAAALSSAPAPRPGFAPRYRAAFGRDPGPYAALGHAAMTRVLDAIAAAGDAANRRQAVIDAYFRGAAPSVAPDGRRLGPVFTVVPAATSPASG